MSNKDFLDKSASEYHTDIVKDWETLYERKRQYLFETLKQYHVPGSALELGSADGIMTEKLCEEFDHVTVVDGSKIFLDQLINKVKKENFSVEHALFEEFDPEVKFDNIFMTHILEHLKDPVHVLKRAKNWLTPNGRILVAVPNANSLHRHVGVQLGMLKEPHSLNDQDVKLGHFRVYYPEQLKENITSAGYEIIKFGGCMIKPLSNRQISKQWSEELIGAFFGLSEVFPELCSEMYVIAQSKD